MWVGVRAIVFQIENIALSHLIHIQGETAVTYLRNVPLAIRKLLRAMDVPSNGEVAE